MSHPSDASDELTSNRIDQLQFRSVLGNYASGVAIVTANYNGELIGMTAQSFNSLSLDPPLVMFCPTRVSTSWPKIREAQHFAANILAEGQEELGLRFARRDIDRFEGISWRPGPSGAPLLDDVLAHVDCTIEAVHDGGDHYIVVGRVLHLHAASDKQPLVFFRSSFGSLASHDEAPDRPTTFESGQA